MGTSSSTVPGGAEHTGALSVAWQVLTAKLQNSREKLRQLTLAPFCPDLSADRMSALPHQQLKTKATDGQSGAGLVPALSKGPCEHWVEWGGLRPRLKP